MAASTSRSRLGKVYLPGLVSEVPGSSFVASASPDVSILRAPDLHVQLTLWGNPAPSASAFKAQLSSSGALGGLSPSLDARGLPLWASALHSVEMLCFLESGGPVSVTLAPPVPVTGSRAALSGCGRNR